MEINGTTVNDVWQKAYLALQDNPAARQQQSRTGLTMELMRAMLSIEKPTERWIVRRVPGINPAFALAEVIWIVTGRDDAQFLNYWNAQLPKYAGTDDCYHGAYGHRLRRKFNFDQLERAFSTLNNNPESRQVVLQIWDAQSDFPMKDGQPVARDIPCNTHAYLKVRDGKLEWTQMMRSNDVMRGLPYNVIQFTSLQEILAGWLNLEVGTYGHYSDSLHLYEADADDFSLNDAVETYPNTDDLRLSKSASDQCFATLGQAIDTIVFNRCSQPELLEIVQEAGLPTAYQHWLYIIGAEESRRQNWAEIQNTLIQRISNPALQQVWRQWEMRFRQPQVTSSRIGVNRND